MKTSAATLLLLFFLTPINVHAANLLTCQGKQLIVTTDKLEIIIEGGAIIRTKNLQNNSTIIDQSDPYSGRPNEAGGFVGFCSKDKSGSVYARRPSSSTPVNCQSLGQYSSRQTYTGLGDNSTLSITVTIEPSTGDILISSSGTEGSSSYKPYTIDIPLLSASPSQIILGSGASYSRSSPAKNDQSQIVAHGLNAPSVALYEYSSFVLAVSSDSFQAVPDWINLYHTTSSDRLSLHTEPDKTTIPTPNIHSATWRIGIHQNWIGFVKNWQKIVENRTGAKPLWENKTPWVRDVHAMFSGINSYYGNNASKFQELASVTSPKNTLFYLWNGDRIVLFGDHTLGSGIGFQRPDKTELSHIKQYGWPVILYHPYTLIWRQDQMQARIDKLRSQGNLPSGYSFNPDYQGGTASNWYPFWQDAIGTYDDHLSVVHPASSKTQEYFIRNAANYLSAHGASAAYYDTMGIDGSWFFPDNKQLINGKSYLQGEVELAQKMNQAHPELGIMSEFQANWLLPYTFFTWEGTDTHTYQKKFLPLVLNHPLRVALIGRYTWAREDSTDSAQDDEMAALLGTLPAYHLSGDYPIPSSRLTWLQNRAKLFVAEKLFNDVPNSWDPEARAYYRNHAGYWFKFKKVNGIWSYVQEVPGQADIVRLNANGTVNPGPSSSSVSPTRHPTSPPTTTITPFTRPSSTITTRPATPTILPSSVPTIAKIVGDATGDGVVNLLDFSRWKLEYLGTLSTRTADFDLSGIVDLLDFRTWKSLYLK